MTALDRLAIDEIGIPALVLMEVAGRAVADAAAELYDEDGRPVLALAGTGNNGGDAIVAARHLHERGILVTAMVLGSQARLTSDAAAEIKMAERLGLPVAYVEDETALPTFEDALSSCGTIIDGLFGTGLAREVEGWRKVAVEHLSHRDDVAVVAVDIPSGVDADTGQILGAAIRADITVTFQHPKLGHIHYPGRAYTGALRVVDIGIPPSLLPRVQPTTFVVSTTCLRQAFGLRSANAHKGTFGHLLVVAGAPDRPGSALLAARAALRTGAGLVTVGSDRETIARLSAVFDPLMGLSLGLHRPEPAAVQQALESRSALAVGPSLPPDPRTLVMLKAALSDALRPAVLDAGALGALGTDVEWLRSRPAPTVLTPHPKEMARLTGLDTAAVQKDRLATAVALAKRAGAHVVLKGASTVVAHPNGRAGFIVRGNAGMATGGTGDVLTGIIGALLAQGVAPDVAAEAGALLHAMAGDRAAEKTGEVGLTAPDLIQAIPEVLRRDVEGHDD